MAPSNLGVPSALLSTATQRLPVRVISRVSPLVVLPKSGVIDLGDFPSRLELSPDGKLIATGSWMGHFTSCGKERP